LFLQSRGVDNMPVIERSKKAAEKLAGRGKPRPPEARETVRQTKPLTFRFSDDGLVPNNSALPFVLYRAAVRLTKASDPAALCEALFRTNGWGDA
jgi:hypothetical protein